MERTSAMEKNSSTTSAVILGYKYLVSIYKTKGASSAAFFHESNLIAYNIYSEVKVFPPGLSVTTTLILAPPIAARPLYQNTTPAPHTNHSARWCRWPCSKPATDAELRTTPVDLKLYAECKSIVAAKLAR